MCNRSLVLELLLVVTLASSALSAASCSWRAAGSNLFGGEICILQKVYDDCQEKSDFTECLKQKALTSISRAIDMVSRVFERVLIFIDNSHVICFPRIPFNWSME